MKLIFIRYGETTGDVEDRFGGAYDDKLSGEGELQARRLGQELAGRGIERIVTSGLMRARQTGALLAEALGEAVVVDTRLSERDQYGALSGMVKAEARARHPELVESLKDRLFTAPGGESYEDFRLRVTEAFEEVAEGDKVTAIIWHGSGMRVLFRDILQMGELAEIGDCCWVELERGSGGWRIGESRRIGFGPWYAGVSDA